MSEKPTIRLTMTDGDRQAFIDITREMLNDPEAWEFVRYEFRGVVERYEKLLEHIGAGHAAQ